MNDLDRISYGCYLNYANQQITNQIHHLFDYGITGMGIAGTTGHSEKSVCGKVLAHENHIYIQALPIEIFKGLLTESQENNSEIDFCPICTEIFYAFTKRK